MGFMSQRYTPHCCFVYFTANQNYITKIIKFDEELILRDIKSFELFKEKIEKGELLEKDLYLYERSQKGEEVYFWECVPIKNDKFSKHIFAKNTLDFFFGIGEGRVYVKEGRFNTIDEGKKKILDKDGYLIDNPNYKFKEFEKDYQLFRYCKLG